MKKIWLILVSTSLVLAAFLLAWGGNSFFDMSLIRYIFSAPKVEATSTSKPIPAAQKLDLVRAAESAAVNGSGAVAVRAVPLSSIVGFPELNELQLCSGSDTLAFLVYTNSSVPLNDVEIVMRHGGGLEYGGFVSGN